MGKSALLRNGKGSNVDKVQDSDTSFLVSNKADKIAKEDHLEDSKTTPKSCLGLVFELSSYWPLPLAQAIQTHCLNHFGFLSLNYKLKDIDQLCYDKKRMDCRCPWTSDAYFLVQQKALEDFSAKQDKANKLARLIASMVDTQDNVS